MNGDMANLGLDFTCWDLDRHGNKRWYWRRKGWKKVRLNPRGVTVGSPEFFELYRHAEKAFLQGKPAKSSYEDGTLGKLIDAYMSSTSFGDLKATTQTARARILRDMQKSHGDKSDKMTAAAVRAGRDARRSTPSAANNRVKIISALYSWAIDDGRAEINPALGVKRLKEGAGLHTWTRDEIQRYRAHWPLGTRQRLAIELFYGLAQRRADVAALGPQNVTGAKIRFTQGKTGRHLVLPISNDLAEALRVTPPARPLSFLGYKNGDSLSNMFRQWCDAAGLPKHCASHGLRKARATHLAEEGKTVHEIASVTGHTTLSEVQRYTREVDQERLAEDAMGEQSVPRGLKHIQSGTTPKEKNT